jgi:hypothetical protein
MSHEMSQNVAIVSLQDWERQYKKERSSTTDPESLASSLDRRGQKKIRDGRLADYSKRHRASSIW